MKQRLTLLIVSLLWACAGYAQTVMSIAEARQQSLGTVVTVEGVVTNDQNYDNRNRSRAIQDATGGIWIFAPGNATLQALKEGDKIRITGELGDFRTLLQIVNPSAIEVIATGEPLPAPVVLTVSDLSNAAVAEQYEGMLVKVEDVILDTSDDVFGSGSSGRSYDIDDPNNPIPGNCFPISSDCGPVYRINPGNSLVGVEIASGLVTLSGPLGSFDGVYQIVPRGIKDYKVGLAVTNLQQKNVFSTRFTLTWTTNISAKHTVKWGRLTLNSVTNDVAIYDTTFIGTIEGTNFVKQHSVEITGLSPASFYFFSILNETEEGKKVTIYDFFATASESSGTIRVVFNKAVDTQLSRGSNAEVSSNIANIIASYIDMAQVSVDVAMYNANTAGATQIINALNRAYQRGVQVRYIYDHSRPNSALTNLNPAIPRLGDNSRSGGIMHNKFVVIDADSRTNSYVITGSGNWTNNNLSTDPNHFLFIQDQTLARVYRAEFEEMWGSATATPDASKARFGSKKIKNTPSQVMVGGKKIEVYFAPTDNTKSAIQNAIYSCNNDLRFGLLLITDSDLAAAIDSMQNVGWDVKGVVDDRNEDTGQPVTGSMVNWLITRNVNVQRYSLLNAAQLHHKYLIVDAARPSSDPLVVVGSYNWSNTANTSNDENTLIIHDATVANHFLQEFGQRYFEVTGIRDAYLTPTEDLQAVTVEVYPNPARGRFTVQHLQSGAHLMLYDMKGRVLWNATAASPSMEVEAALQEGLYLLLIEQNGKQFVQKIMIQR
ncbi:phosphatidylserine/phosphatidylglycerophosphate/cardiolipin synthase-like enzyme [Thermonema lapsum]|uniref:phospholipase D n=1 Tax=Thermonema lapsum TaxID=28195 RepID=A0A846MN09_9BACT|nr:phospholipase D-like domain-containing protein [Thermonema lapsum]NIK72841.1 phosphatidylserine/phosphatidylglycerophosphate/cardiolipin synthase-like enzyme [Thermonema lapsum]